jgi:predicted GH43/DUF377 family glycosyl hydrolase
MQWEKMGIVYKPDGTADWKQHSALTPTPIVFDDKIRVYAGFRDIDGVSRIGYVDLDKKDPSKIIKISIIPVLDIGIEGVFDDNGLILGDVIWVDKKLYMYYVGFQLVKKVKFLAFTGLAISEDAGETFIKYSDVPVLDRKANSLYFNAIHTVIYSDNVFKYWLGAGSSWEKINEVFYPSYNVKYIESADGINFKEPSLDCVQFSRKDEYRIGRPRVYKTGSGYEMIFTWGDLSGNYQMGYAVSHDGKEWHRNDEELNFHPSTNGWDDKSVSYGALFTVNENTYMVYNGNNMGKEGFGLALLKK